MRKVFWAVIVVVALILTSAAVQAKSDGVPEWLERILLTEKSL